MVPSILALPYSRPIATAILSRTSKSNNVHIRTRQLTYAHLEEIIHAIYTLSKR